MNVAILGSGPSGLVAAWATYQFTGVDHSVAIFSPGERSTIWGAQYLHQPIPGVSLEMPHVIRYQMAGRPEDYLMKVYNGLWDGHISDDLRDQAHCAWDLRASYARLWDFFSPHMFNFMIGPNPSVNARNYHGLLTEYDMVVNTIPRKVFCQDAKHQFKHTEIWAMGDTDERRVPVTTDEGIIEYNGKEETAHYRAARIFGYSTVEWPGNVNRPPIPGVARVRKPISHNCDCFPEVKHLGRMGRYDKNKLVHNVYADMTELLMIETEGK